MLTGLCDIFDRYHEFISAYENAIRNKNYAKMNNLNEYSMYVVEVRQGEVFKQKFEKALLKEIYVFSEEFHETITLILKDFKELLLKINIEVSEIFLYRK